MVRSAGGVWHSPRNGTLTDEKRLVGTARSTPVRWSVARVSCWLQKSLLRAFVNALGVYDERHLADDAENLVNQRVYVHTDQVVAG